MKRSLTQCDTPMNEQRMPADPGGLAERRLDDFMAITDDWLWETDGEHRFTYFSANVRQRFADGVADIRARLLGKTRWEAAGIDPDADPHWRQHRDDMAAHRPFRDFRITSRIAGDRPRHLRISGKPVFDAHGRFCGYRGIGTDETEVMEAERRRERAEQLLRDAVESISEGFVIYDADDRFVMCNAKFRELHPHLFDSDIVGMRFEDIVRKGVSAGQYPQARGGEDEWVARRVAQHRDAGGSVEQQIADGRWLLISERTMKNGGIAGLRMDITALKKAEAALRRSEERYALALEGSNDGLWDWDLREDKTFYSQRMLDIIGFDPLDCQRGVDAWLDAIHPDDLGRYSSAFIKHILGEAGHFECEFRIRGSDGQERWVVSRGKGLCDASGRMQRIAGSIRDLTAQKEIEQRRRREVEEFQRDLEAEICERGRAEETVRQANQQLSAVIGASPYAIFGLDPAHDVVIWNRTAETLFGYSAVAAVGRKVPIFPPDAAPEFERILAQASAGEFVRASVLAARTCQGLDLTLSISATAIHEADGALRLIVVTLEDVTGRVQIEEQLRQSQKMEALGRLTGGIAHDFNNMLGVVVGNLDMVLETPNIDPDTLEICGQALDAALLCTDLVGRLMSFSRKRPLHLAPVSLEAKLTSLVPMLRRTIGEDIEIAAPIGERLWPIATDPGQFETALVNLAINARDAMPNGGRLTIAARNHTPGPNFADRYPSIPARDYVVIAVTDTGTGMAPDVVRRCLEPFFTTKGLTGGTGLGLSMVYGLLKQSQGHVHIESELGHGTTIELLFPHLPHAAAEPVLLGAGADRETVRGGHERILVVEDNAALRRTAATTLGHLGYAVTEAENAATALDILSAGIAIDLVFTDVVMPGRLNGVGLVREIERRYPGIRIVFTSGYTSTPEIEAQIAASGHPLLAKPYRKIELAGLLRAVLDGNSVPGTLERAQANEGAVVQ
jgi:PAS domain S-box-containing protein